MKFLGFWIGVALIVLGILCLTAATLANAKPRLIVGAVLLVAGIMLILVLVLRRERPPAPAGYQARGEIAPSIAPTPVPGDGSIRCRRCGKQIMPSDIRTRTREDGEFVECPHCGALFEFQEDN